MDTNLAILLQLVKEDFGLDDRGTKWARALEHDSLIIDKERGVFFWNSEHIVGDALVYLTKVRKLPFEVARNHLKNYEYTGTHIYTIQTKKEDVVVYPKLVQIFYEDGFNNRSYFYDRGLTDETIARFQLGFWNGYVTVPFFFDGTFRNFQLRKDNPKVIRSYYKNVGPLLFNSDILKLTNKIYFTEGPIDAMVLIQNGLQAISTNSGGSFLPEWFIKFVHQDEIILLMDNDVAGYGEANRLAKALGINRCKIYCFEDFETKGYDPVDFFRDGYSKTDLEYLLEKKAKFLYELPKVEKRNRLYLK